MNQLDTLVEREKRKVHLLREKLAQSEAQLAALLSMRSQDSLDRWLDQQLETPTGVTVTFEVKNPTTNEPKVRQKPIPPNWAKLLNFIGTQGKTTTEVEQFLNFGTVSLSATAARTGLANFRKEYGFVENPKRGFYRLTPSGLAAVDAQKESPAT